MHILFLGNSHTFYHAMPYQCGALLEALGLDAHVSTVTEGGKSLAWHVENPSSAQALQYRRWDHVILQRVTHPFPGTAPLRDAVARLIDLTSAGPRVWLYKTWCEKEIQENQGPIDEAFGMVSGEQGLPIIPVADAWHEVERRDPGHELYDADARHAGPPGSYLTALCMTRALSGQSVQGLPSTLQRGEKTLIDIPTPAAELYQSVVDQIIQVG